MVLGVAPLTIKPNDLLVLPSWGFVDLAFLVRKDFFQQINNYGLTELEATTLISPFGGSHEIGRAFLVAQLVKNLPAMQETPVQSLGWEDPLEKGMATHFSILAWSIPMDGGAGQATVCGVAKSWT